MVAAPELDDVRLRLRRTPADSDGRGSPGRMDRRRALLLTAAVCVPLAALVYVAAVDVLAFRQLDIRVSAGFIALSGPHTRALAGDLAGLMDPRQVSPKA